MWKGFREDGTMRYSDGEPLTSSMDNVLASRLGEIAKKAAKAPAGDYIDTGLVLRSLLEEAGFELREKQ